MRLSILLIIIITLFQNALLNTQDKKNKNIFYNVKKVVDGDTFWIDDGSQKGLKVRLIGVDAPESKKSGTKETASFGREASDYLTTLITGK